MYSRQLNPGRSVWLVNADTLSQILTLNIEFKSSAGAGIAAGVRMPTITWPGENGQTFATIMGRPVIVTEACDTVGDEGDIIFADLAGGYFAPYKAGGIRSDLSMHLWFDQGVTAFRWTMRVGGQPWLSAAVSAKNSAATRSSVVTCAVR
jgi:HK97 family phage major capsid protein